MKQLCATSSIHSHFRHYYCPRRVIGQRIILLIAFNIPVQVRHNSLVPTMCRCSNWLLLTFTICSSITPIRSSVPVEFQHVGHRFPNTRSQSNKQILRDFDSSVDFEDDTYVESWIEESRSSVKWKTENYDSQWEPDNRAPRPDSGKRYLRVDRGTSKSFGVAILRSSNLDWLPDNSAPILMSFSYWIRSKWPNFNNLEVLI